VRPSQARRLLIPEQLHQLETFVSQTALAIERAQLADEAQQAQVRIETEQMRNSLLSSVSHDLRTPLATITGVTGSLIDGREALDAGTRRELLEMAHEEAQRLSRLVDNLLEMTRIDAGAVWVHKEWQPLEEVLGVALNRLETPLANRIVPVNLPPDLPLVPLDGILIEQVLVNLVENALKHTQPNSPIEISARASRQGVTFEVADRGPGLPPGDEQRVFEKFYRVSSTSKSGGTGLGLTICKGIVEAHGGRIWAENRPGGGAIFRFTLPFDGEPPSMPADASMDEAQ
jgi:two-component system sensor histidine kinase KdpD